MTNKDKPGGRIIYADTLELRSTTAEGGRLLARFANSQGESAVIGLDGKATGDLLAALVHACATENAPAEMRAAVQIVAIRELKPALIGAATAVLRQELEAGVSMTTTVDSETLEALRDDCEKVLSALAVSNRSVSKH